MKKYVQQLIEDLNDLKRDAAINRNAYFNGDCVNEYLILDEVDERGIKVSDLIGLDVYVLPELDYLNRDELSELVKTFSSLWEAYGLSPMFSSCTSDGVRYLQMREYLNEFVFPSQDDKIDIEMCDYMPHNCPFVSVCSSIKLGNPKCSNSCTSGNEVNEAAC